MTLQQLRLLLRQHGIETQESLGQPFDPHRHDAVSKRHDPAQADHVILEVLQCGYQRGEKVFRPAKVVINDRTHSKQARHAWCFDDRSNGANRRSVIFFNGGKQAR